MGWDGLNRRKFPRVNYPCLVILRKDDKNEEKDVILTHTENLGLGGICVILKKDIKMFTPVELELDLLDLQKHIRCQGKVVWNIQRKVDVSKKPLFYDIGIEFMDLPEPEQQRIQTVVKKLVKTTEKTSLSE